MCKYHDVIASYWTHCSLLLPRLLIYSLWFEVISKHLIRGRLIFTATCKCEFSKCHITIMNVDLQCPGSRGGGACGLTYLIEIVDHRQMVPHCIDRFHCRSGSSSKHWQLDPIHMWMRKQCQRLAWSVCMRTMHIRPIWQKVQIYHPNLLFRSTELTHVKTRRNKKKMAAVTLPVP